MAVGMGGGSASGYYNQSDIESAYRSVNEQTGIQAARAGSTSPSVATPS